MSTKSAFLEPEICPSPMVTMKSFNTATVSFVIVPFLNLDLISSMVVVVDSTSVVFFDRLVLEDRDDEAGRLCSDDLAE